MGKRGGKRGVHMSHPDPKMTSPKTSGPEMGAKVCYSNNKKKHMSHTPRSQDDIPKNIRT
jgi:hypothetical protein